MLTERRIRDAKPEARTRILWDSQVKELGLRITPRGTKSYILNYRVAMQECRATLARASELSLKAARERAAEELAAIRAGRPHPLERRREANAAPTVADGLDRFFNKFAPARIAIGHMTARTVKDYRKQALQYLVPALGKRKIRDLLGHRTTAMADRYIRSVGNPVRDARELVGAAMAAMMQGEPDSDVVQTPRGQRPAPEAP